MPVAAARDLSRLMTSLPGHPLRPLADRLASWLLPAGCLACGRPLPAARSPLGLCAGCRDRLPRLEPRESCAVCGQPLAAGRLPEGFRCPACVHHPPSYDRLLAPWRYAAPLDEVLQAFKFRRLDYLGEHLASAIAENLARDLTGFDLLTHVPLHWWRQLRRGYDQAREIARPLARRLGVSHRATLVRRQATPAQSGLGRAERLRNLRSAFGVRGVSRIAGRRILLVDDVATTGATLDAAARTLRAAGAAAVVAVVAARTPFTLPID
jgi:ComF family protein